MNICSAKTQQDILYTRQYLKKNHLDDFALDFESRIRKENARHVEMLNHGRDYDVVFRMYNKRINRHERIVLGRSASVVVPERLRINKI